MIERMRIKNILVSVLVVAILSLPSSANSINPCTAANKSAAATPASSAATPGTPVSHPVSGKEVFECDSLKMTLVRKIQSYCRDTASRDGDVRSPKSVNFHPGGEKFYIHSLEGMKSVVYGFPEIEKLGTISHSFSSADKSIWAPESGLYLFNDQFKDTFTFSGKPVESTFSHGGKYLWITYYRRSFDTNAQNPSAVVVIDTQKDSIVRAFETGPLPKMIAASPNGKWLAVTHWGDNTVGLMEISSEDPADWHYAANVVIGQKLKLNYKASERVNRDVDSGLCLRGTLFTRDSEYLLVGCMCGSGGIAVINVEKCAYLGKIHGSKPNVRHLICKDNYLYASINMAGYVQRTRMFNVYAAIEELEKGAKTAKIVEWDNCKVFPGARTIVSSPDGRFIFAACHGSSRIAVVETRTMTMLGSIGADSYPVGLAISKDGDWLISTSQGRDGSGGNAVDVYKIEYK